MSTDSGVPGVCPKTPGLVAPGVDLTGVLYTCVGDVLHAPRRMCTVLCTGVERRTLGSGKQALWSDSMAASCCLLSGCACSPAAFSFPFGWADVLGEGWRPDESRASVHRSSLSPPSAKNLQARGQSLPGSVRFVAFIQAAAPTRSSRSGVCVCLKIFWRNSETAEYIADNRGASRSVIPDATWDVEGTLGPADPEEPDLLPSNLGPPDAGPLPRGVCLDAICAMGGKEGPADGTRARLDYLSTTHNASRASKRQKGKG